MAHTANTPPDTRTEKHIYLTGNFAPIHRTLTLHRCDTIGRIPDELGAGLYVRNGGNPLKKKHPNQNAHWYDGDGMLSGVYFCLESGGQRVQPKFTNQYAMTDIFMAGASGPAIEEPILPSIATFLVPRNILTDFMRSMWRTMSITAKSWLPGSRCPIRRVSVANTNIVYHDGRALALCESGPPLRMSLPELRTVGWFNGIVSEGERGSGLGMPGFGCSRFPRLFQEMTTAHPRVDPATEELIMFHSTYFHPFVTYSVIPKAKPGEIPQSTRIGTPVPGINGPKLMHDFGVSRGYTIIVDLPLKFRPRNMLLNRPVIDYQPSQRTRFGIFPRHNPGDIRWFQTEACCIFHTVNSWETRSPVGGKGINLYVNMLVCRMNSPSILFTTAGIQPPSWPSEKEGLQCRLYFYQFDLGQPWNAISQQWALSAIPFEFPHVPKNLALKPARYVYGCSSSEGSFDAALGKGVKIDCLAKIDVESLIRQGLDTPPEPITGCIDGRSVDEILKQKRDDDPIQIFKMPPGWYAQECSFVPKKGHMEEDSGWLLSYVFDESQLTEDGEAKDDARSELWVIDAQSMSDIVARIVLPQRVPYGMHGNWFSKEDIEHQRPVTAYRNI